MEFKFVSEIIELIQAGETVICCESPIQERKRLLYNIALSFSIISRQPQQLPISAVAQIGNKKIQLEVAQTPEELAKGLKFRKQLPQDTGMLFELGKSVEKAPFWMKDVHIPLDILFLQDGVVKTIVQNAPPCPKEPCKIYYSTEPVHQVLELAAGSVARLGVKEGTTLKITDKTRG